MVAAKQIHRDCFVVAEGAASSAIVGNFIQLSIPSSTKKQRERYLLPLKAL